MLTTTINIKQLNWVPVKGEHWISVDVAKVTDVGTLWTFAESVGFRPELVAINYPNRVEVHLMLLHEHLQPGTLLGFEHASMIDQLAEVGVPDDAIRHCYGGDMAVE